MNSLVAAVVQLTSTAEVARNLDQAAALCRRAKARGAQLIALPENFALLSSDEKEKFAHAQTLGASNGGGAGEGGAGEGAAATAIVDRMRAVARELGVHLVLGGLPERGTGAAAGHVYNACVHLLPDGEIGAIYRKIHLFDVHFPAAGTSLCESATVAAGDPEQAVVADTPFGGIGLSVCYDLRFPELYRRLVNRGARFLVVPAAFTLHTGKDHWHVLLRARAIENQCFVLAPAQQGRHSASRQTYGHSLIVDPWGTVLADCPDGEGVAVAELDLSAQERIRQELPALQHRRVTAVS
jgi:predicted amidohydrolase